MVYRHVKQSGERRDTPLASADINGRLLSVTDSKVPTTIPTLHATDTPRLGSWRWIRGMRVISHQTSPGPLIDF